MDGSGSGVFVPGIKNGVGAYASGGGAYITSGVGALAHPATRRTRERATITLRVIAFMPVARR